MIFIFPLRLPKKRKNGDRAALSFENNDGEYPCRCAELLRRTVETIHRSKNGRVLYKGSATSFRSKDSPTNSSGCHRQILRMRFGRSTETRTLSCRRSRLWVGSRCLHRLEFSRRSRIRRWGGYDQRTGSFFSIRTIFFQSNFQLDVARQFVSHQTKEFGFAKANVDFRLGKIEDLVGECQLETNSFDVVM